MDAVNVDLKAFSADFYRRLCAGQLQPVLDTLLYLHQHTEVWMELTTLLIPGENDSDEELSAMCEWIATHLGPDVPLHFTAFHPDWKMRNKPPTPSSTLSRARRTGLDAGLHYVYTGNVHDTDGGTTACPHCHSTLIVRDWYDILRYRLTDDGRCPDCQHAVAGRFGHFGQAFGNRRLPVRTRSLSGFGNRHEK